MKEEFEKGLKITDPLMAPVRTLTNSAIQGVISDMIAKDATTGSVTLKITFEREQVVMKNRPPAQKLNFSYKVSNAITLKSEVKGEQENNGDELENVDNEWILMPITGAAQRTLLDKEDA